MRMREHANLFGLGLPYALSHSRIKTGEKNTSNEQNSGSYPGFIMDKRPGCPRTQRLNKASDGVNDFCMAARANDDDFFYGVRGVEAL